MLINADALRALREKDGHTSRSLAAASRVSHSRINELEQPGLRHIRPSTAKRLAEALAVPVSAFTYSVPPQSVREGAA